MKRIGTFASAAALIFVGIWMIIARMDAELGSQVFKWWPVIIIILGIEVLFQFSRRDGERVRINYLIIPVIIVMLFVSIFEGIRYNLSDAFSNINIAGIHLSDGDLNHYKIIKTTRNLPAYGNKIYLTADNAGIYLKNSTDGNIKIDAEVYVDKNESMDKYDISEKKETDGYSIVVNESYVKQVKLYVYLPAGMNIKTEADNLDFDTRDSLNTSNFEIKSQNCNLRIDGAQSLALDFQNGNINLYDVNKINLTGGNSNISIHGNTEYADVKSDQGKITIDNKICRDIKLDLGQGMATVNTDDENAAVNISLNQGLSGINGAKSVNSGMAKTFGAGSGRVDIKVNQGTAQFRN